jgi:hypothetical protein
MNSLQTQRWKKWLCSLCLFFLLSECCEPRQEPIFEGREALGTATGGWEAKRAPILASWRFWCTACVFTACAGVFANVMLYKYLITPNECKRRIETEVWAVNSNLIKENAIIKKNLKNRESELNIERNSTAEKLSRQEQALTARIEQIEAALTEGSRQLEIEKSNTTTAVRQYQEQVRLYGLFKSRMPPPNSKKPVTVVMRKRPAKPT